MIRPLNQLSALQDIWQGVTNVALWYYLASFDIRGRYRRTVLGPIWTALNALIFASIIAVVYSTFWKMELKEFLPYVAAGYFVWIFIATSFQEGCSVYYMSGAFLKAAPISPITFNMRVVTRNLIVFLHSLIVYIAIAVITGISLSKLYWIIPGLAILYVFCFAVSVFLSVLCSRYRDFEQVVSSVILAAFFVTPILYDTAMLGNSNAGSILRFNVFTYFLQIVRDPMMGKVPSQEYYVICLAVTAATLLLALVSYSLARKRLYLWL